MKVRVRLFAAIRQAAGQEAIDLDLPDGSRVCDVRQRLVAAVPALGTLAGAALFAVNARYANDAQPVPPGAEVSCIPPVSGG